MTRILTAEDVWRLRQRYPHADALALCDSHEALRARVAELEAPNAARREAIAEAVMVCEGVSRAYAKGGQNAHATGASACATCVGAMDDEP